MKRAKHILHVEMIEQMKADLVNAPSQIESLTITVSSFKPDHGKEGVILLPPSAVAKQSQAWSPTDEDKNPEVKVELGRPCMISGLRIKGSNNGLYVTSVVVQAGYITEIVNPDDTKTITKVINFSSPQTYKACANHHEVVFIAFSSCLEGDVFCLRPKAFSQAGCALCFDICFAPLPFYPPYDLENLADARNSALKHTPAVLSGSNRQKFVIFVQSECSLDRIELINTLAIALYGAPSGERHMTSTSTSKVRHIELKEQTPYLFIEYPSVTESTGADPMNLIHCLNGVLPDRWNITELLNPYSKKPEFPVKYQNIPQIVLVAIPAKEMDNPEAWQKFKKLARECKRRQLPIFVVITNPSSVNPDVLKQNPQLVVSDEFMRLKFEKACKMKRVDEETTAQLNIEEKHLFFLECYPDDYLDQSEAINSMALTLLNAIRTECERCVKMWKRELLRFYCDCAHEE